jgi:hypothetical protein
LQSELSLRKNSIANHEKGSTMTTNSYTPVSRKRIGWIAGLAVIPIALLLAGVLYSIRTEQAAAAELGRITQYGGSADAWAAKRFRSSTHTEGTAAWSKISMLAGAASELGSVVPLVGKVEFPEDFDPTAEWREEPAIAAYLAEMQPVLELIHASKDVPKPVWQPVHFSGVGTLLPHLQNSRQVMRVLQLEALHAMHKREPERVLAALESMQATADVYDWHLYLVGEFVHIALKGMLAYTLEDALQVDMWTPEQLDTLATYVADPSDIAESWEKSFLFEETMAAEFQTALPMISSKDRLAMLKKYRQIESLGKLPVGQLSTAAQRLQEEMTASSYLEGQLLPAVAQCAAAWERMEYQRRLTKTSIAVKRYEMKHGSWPTQLEDLTDVGLTSEDWSIPKLGKFGYEVFEDSVVVFNFIEFRSLVVQQDGSRLTVPNSIVRLENASYHNVRVR